VERGLVAHPRQHFSAQRVIFGIPAQPQRSAQVASAGLGLTGVVGHPSRELV
jgi:hypothetical protein